MKHFLFALAILSFVLGSCGTPKTVDQFYRKFKREQGVRNFAIPGWLVWFGSGIAYDFVKDEDAKIALRLARKVKGMKIMVSEGGNPIPAEEIEQFVQNIRQKNFEDLILVKDGDTHVNIMVREKEEKLKNIVVLVDDAEEFVFLSLKSNITMKDLSDVISSFTKKKITKEQDEKQDKKKKKKKEKDVPIAEKKNQA